MNERFDLIVIGGGRAANLAIAAGNKGLKTVLLERDRLGGTCPNRGCVPSKLLIGFADVARQIKESTRHFINAEITEIKLADIFKSVNNYVSGVHGRYASRMPDSVELIRGEASFIGEKTVQADGRILTADKIVIATGSRPRPASFSDLPVWYSDDLFPISGSLPKSILIVGGGVIGCELSSFFSAVGVETTIIVRGERLLPKVDKDIEEVFREQFSSKVRTVFNATTDDLKYDGNSFTARVLSAANSIDIQADKVLFATGRIPNTENLNLNATGLRADHRGFIKVNEELETDVPGIYAAGDVNGRHMLQHAASFEVQYLRGKLLKGESGPISVKHIGYAIYSYPEVASVGLTEQMLQDQGTPYVMVMRDWLASARAMAMRIEYPKIKLLVSPEDYRILGCHMVGPESDTMIHQVIAVMELKNDVRELAGMVYIHPALNECILAAAVEAVGKVRAYQGSS